MTASERRDFENAYRIMHRDGRERWVRESSGPVLDRDGVVRWIEEVLGQHHSMFCEAAYVAAPLWIQASYNPIFNTDGKPCKVAKFATDVSDRRAMPENLRAAKDRAALAAESKTSLLANMGHEIGTPMAC